MIAAVAVVDGRGATSAWAWMIAAAVVAERPVEAGHSLAGATAADAAEDDAGLEVVLSSSGPYPAAAAAVAVEEEDPSDVAVAVVVVVVEVVAAAAVAVAADRFVPPVVSGP